MSASPHRLGHGRARLAGALAAAGALGLLAPASGAGAMSVVYSVDAGANAIHDGDNGVLGLRDVLRQAPVSVSSRFPTERLMGKVSGRALAALPDAGAMAEALRAGQRTVTTRSGTSPVGGRVGVDEINPAHWSTARSAALREALRLMGDDAERVVFYASPALVEQVGRRDPRQRLAAGHAALVDALGSGGHTFLEVYRGDLRPFPQREMANHLTRWQGRWPAARAESLHVLVGPGVGASQEAIWNRVRATEAGRALLLNGPGAFGMRSAQDGRAWLAEYRDYLDRPASAPAGEAQLIRGGGDRLMVPTGARLRPGGRVRLSLSRSSSAIAALVTRAGQRRVFQKLAVKRAGTVTLRLPARVRPGRYRIVVYVSGDGITDRVERNVRFVR